MEQIGTKLQHYKGGKYTVIGLGTHSETMEDVLIYQNDADKRTWVRPVQMFYENVDYEGRWVPRFTVIS